MIYTAYQPALAILEVRVHLDLPFDLLPDDYVLMEIEAPNTFEEVGPLASVADPQAIGDAWLASQGSASLKVPSILAPHGWNYLLNPRHPDAKNLAILNITPFEFDSRLWS